MAEDRLNSAYKDRFEEILRDAISRETVYGQGNVPSLAKYLRGIFLDAGFEKSAVTLIPYGETASLLVRLNGNNQSARQPILFAAHMDVVPADSSDWERDPFELQQNDEFFFGRGVLDNKFDVSILTTLFIFLKETNFVPNRDLVIAFTGDEESFQETIQQLVRDYRDLIDAEYAFVVDDAGGVLNDQGKATYHQIGLAEKTYATFSITAKNQGGHSSMPRADNAIFDLAKALQAIEMHRFPVEFNEITLTYFERTAPSLNDEIGDAMRKLVVDNTDQAAINILRNQPQYVGTLSTTCVPTMLSGGHAENALPRSATAIVNCRIFPGHSPEEILTSLKLVTDNPELDWEIVGAPVSSPTSPLNPEIMDAVASATEAIHPGIPIIPRMNSGTTDGAHLRAAGIPSYSLSGIFMKPKDSFRHGLNERVPKTAVSESLRFWQTLIKELAGP